MYLGVSTILCDREIQGAWLSIGSVDSSRWAVNGQEVGRVYAERPVTPDENKFGPITLKKGTNVLRMTVLNGRGEAGACARFIDSDGKTVKGITVTTLLPRESAPQK